MSGSVSGSSRIGQKAETDPGAPTPRMRDAFSASRAENKARIEASTAPPCQGLLAQTASGSGGHRHVKRFASKKKSAGPRRPLDGDPGRLRE